MSDEATPTPEEEAVAEVVEVIEVEEVDSAEESPTADAEEAPAEKTVSEETAAESPVAETEDAPAEEKPAAESKAVDDDAPAKEEAKEEKESATDSDEEPAAEEKPSHPLTINMIPPEYVPQVRRGRNRRINIDININDVHYKNIPLLSRFLDPFGRILSRRKTKVSAKVQRRAVTAIKQARHLSLLPYTGDHTRLTRRKRR